MYTLLTAKKKKWTNIIPRDINKSQRHLLAETARSILTDPRDRFKASASDEPSTGLQARGVAAHHPRSTLGQVHDERSQSGSVRISELDETRGEGAGGGAFTALQVGGGQNAVVVLGEQDKG